MDLIEEALIIFVTNYLEALKRGRKFKLLNRMQVMDFK